MSTKDYSTRITIPATPQQAYNSINNVTAWWSENMEGSSAQLNDVFTVHFGETSITVQIVALVPGKRVNWLVTDCYKHWLKDKKEWKGTSMSWEISTDNNTTTIDFTHKGLVPGIECYNGCEKAWDFYIKTSLFKLLTEGKGMSEKMRAK